MAVVQLGGHPVTFRTDEIGVDGREPVEDIARMLAGYHAALGARVFDHRRPRAAGGRRRRSRWSTSCPTTATRARRSPTCSRCARQSGELDGPHASPGSATSTTSPAAWRSAPRCCGMRLRVASPPGYGPSDADLDRLVAAGLDDVAVITDRPHEAAEGADVVYTDVWASMGQEDEADARAPRLRGLPGRRPGDGRGRRATPIFMHCLPAHRGEEVAAEVVDGPQSAVFPQAHNRMHAARPAASTWRR